MLSRADFEKSCKAFLSKVASSDDEVFGGWSWNEHAYLSRLGYLSRKRTARSYANTAGVGEEDEVLTGQSETDPATAATCEECDLLEVWQYIVYSATFQVPTFYFSVHTRSGSPLTLDGILSSSLFRRNVFPDARKTGFALQTPDHPFPLLSQGEHPTLGTPCWFFHPCETPVALTELVRADGGADTSPGRLMELWLLLVGNVVNLKD
ncbi:hypothetical protein A7U60_g5413 [Sanghuangporus baumii]|uniref:Ubiquitin-like-conjugating enzyme ATG10 n=1 Tax=Sanghuangporus baumii TaxID=108892 RepID=A0A9Q5HWW6_SANBA|nr:hypothetical protein A7U60_g5413 [Sanghuangporus baumii]